MNNLPTYKEISNWSDERLLGIIESIEALNYNVPIYGDETPEDRDDYIETVLAEKKNRKL